MGLATAADPSAHGRHATAARQSQRGEAGRAKEGRMGREGRGGAVVVMPPPPPRYGTRHCGRVNAASFSVGIVAGVVAARSLRVRGGGQLLSLPLLPAVGAVKTRAVAAEAPLPADDAAAAAWERGWRTRGDGAAGRHYRCSYLLNIKSSFPACPPFLILKNLILSHPRHFLTHEKSQVLQALPFPYTITAFQLAWPRSCHSLPATMLGTVFTNMSLSKVAVSCFTVLGETPSLLVLGSLVPIFILRCRRVGIVDGTLIGFWSAMALNLLYQSRNLLSKKLLDSEEEALNDINIFSILTILSFLLFLPLMLFQEGVRFTPGYLWAPKHCLLSNLILARVSPVTHSVPNCVKRVVVTITSVLFFRTPISPVNALGTGAALGGVLLYSRFKRTKPKDTLEARTHASLQFSQFSF
uniref:Sugar phosphate transporter domain-containing protein n=1 Tax=Oryza punctata TaxID=4537 RepID=A0A0E0LM45_ORYPU